MNLLYEHYKIDNPPKTSTITDKDYDEEEQEHVKYEDPEFDKEWDSDDEEDSSDIVAENPPLMPFINEVISDGDEDIEDVQDWEEVD